MPLKLSNFVKLVPETARTELPATLRKFKVFLMPWLAQMYYDDKVAHYELVKLPSKYGENKLEIGLHFESKDHARNVALLTGFDHYLFEIRAALGDDWWAEPWDRGWTKVYTTFTYQALDEALVEQSAHLLAQAILTMQPIYRVVVQRSG
jgi:hypothetical protein